MTFPAAVSEVDFASNPTASYHDTIVSDDAVVGYWRFGSDTSSVLADEKATYPGVVEGTPTLVTGALPFDSDEAMQFDGSTSDAYVVDAPALTPSRFALEGWGKVPSLPASTKLLAGKPGSYKVEINSTGKIVATCKNGPSIAVLTSNTTLATGTFYHVIITYDGGKFYLYLNGILETSLAFAAGVEGSPQPIRFGASSCVTAPVWQSSVTGTGGSGTTSYTINKPAGTAQGDLLVAHIHVGNGNAITPPTTDWVVQANIALSNGSVTRIYTKNAGASEPASYTWTSGTNAMFWTGAITRITGVDSVAAVANPVYAVTQSTGTTHATGSQIPNVDNSLVLAMFAFGNTGQSWTEAVDNGSVTEHYDFAANQGTIAMCAQTQTTATELNVTGTCTGSGAASAIMLVLAGTGLNRTACTLDDWSLWNKTLTADDALDHYTARLSGDSVWTDVSTDSRQFGIQRGRQYELDKIEASTCDEVLVDDQRKYDPSNTSGPHYPNVIPKRKTRKQAVVGGNTYPLFQGFVERWPPKWLSPLYAETEITASDGLALLALAPVAGTIPSSLAGAQINWLLDKAQWSRADRAIDTGLLVMDEWVLPTGEQAKTAIQDIADSELGIFFISAAGVATFHDSAHRWTNARSITPQATFIDPVGIANGGSGILYTGLVPSEDDDHTINQWIVSTASGETATVTDVVSARRSGPLMQTRSTQLKFLADAQAQGLALLQETSRAGQRFDSLTVMPDTDADWETVLGLEISDRVTVIVNPIPGAGGSEVVQDCFIEGVTVNANPGLWSVSFQLSPVSPATYYDTIVRDGPVSFYLLDSVA